MAQITSDLDGFVKLFCDEGGERVEHILVKIGCKARIFHTAEEVGEWIKKELLGYTNRRTLPDIDPEQPSVTQEQPTLMEVDNERG